MEVGGGWGWGLGCPGPAPRSSPRPLRGVLNIKRSAGLARQHLLCIGAERGRDGAGGLVGAPNRPRVLRTWRSNPYHTTPPRPGTSTPTRPGPAPAAAPRADGLLLPQFVRLVRGGHGGVRLRRLRRLQPARRLPIQPPAASLPRGGATLPRPRLLQLRAWGATRPPACALLGR